MAISRPGEWGSVRWDVGREIFLLATPFLTGQCSLACRGHQGLSFAPSLGSLAGELAEIWPWQSLGRESRGPCADMWAVKFLSALMDSGHESGCVLKPLCPSTVGTTLTLRPSIPWAICAGPYLAPGTLTHPVPKESMVCFSAPLWTQVMKVGAF